MLQPTPSTLPTHQQNGISYFLRCQPTLSGLMAKAEGKSRFGSVRPKLLYGSLGGKGEEIVAFMNDFNMASFDSTPNLHGNLLCRQLLRW